MIIPNPGTKIFFILFPLALFCLSNFRRLSNYNNYQLIYASTELEQRGPDRAQPTEEANRTRAVIKEEKNNNQGGKDEVRIRDEANRTTSSAVNETKGKQEGGQDHLQLEAAEERLLECTNKCLWKTGINGSWVQDFEFARDYGQYELPLVVELYQWDRRKKSAGRFVPSKDAPFPWRTSWKWIDRDPDCQVDIMTYENLCRVLVKLQVHRICLWGDSLTEQTYIALMNLLGPSRITLESERRGYFNCTAFVEGSSAESEEYIVTVRLFRLPKRGFYVGRDTFDFITETSDRTIAMFNFGNGAYQNTVFPGYMNDLIQTIEKKWKNRSQDLYFFRPLSPGHEDCSPQDKNFNWTKGTRIRPLSSYNEYNFTPNAKWGWNTYETVNHYAKNFLLERNRQGRLPVIHHLNTWNMTVLRNDAHNPPIDCLHFQEPGPVDWWIHLFHTYLQHLSNDGESVHKQNCRRVETGPDTVRNVSTLSW